jgi:hypothetical protein
MGNGNNLCSISGTVDFLALIKRIADAFSNKTSPFDERTYYQSNFLYREWNWPTYYIDYPESVRCGRGNMDHAKETEVLTVKAGDTLEIAQNRWEPREWTEGMFENCPDDRGTCHPEGWRQVLSYHT